MIVTLAPLQESEIPEYARLQLEAFRSHPRIPMLFPNGYTDDLYAYYEDIERESFHGPESKFMKAIDDDGKMLGVSDWTFARHPQAKAKEPPADPDKKPPGNWPEGGNWELKQFFTVLWDRWTRNTFAGKAYINLNILVVHPNAQRRGVGAALVTWGCDQADKLGVPICLESTPAGLRLYERFGFKEARTVKADMREFGWTRPYDEEAAKRVWMVREPVTRV